MYDQGHLICYYCQRLESEVYPIVELQTIIESRKPNEKHQWFVCVDCAAVHVRESNKPTTQSDNQETK
jgi:hypothetical protein